MNIGYTEAPYPQVKEDRAPISIMAELAETRDALNKSLSILSEVIFQLYNDKIPFETGDSKQEHESVSTIVVDNKIRAVDLLKIMIGLNEMLHN